MQSEDQVYLIINHKLTRVLCFIQTFEFETTTREIGLITLGQLWTYFFFTAI